MNVFSTPSQKANLSHNGFDMSNLLKFTSTTGELLPVYYDILYPGDKMRMATELKTRTMPLDSAAMVNITEHIDWFAVPIDQILSLFSAKFYNIKDIHSSIFSSDVDTTNIIPFIPASTFNSVVSEILDEGSSYYVDRYFNSSLYLSDLPVYFCTSFRLFEFFGIPLLNRGDEAGITGGDYTTSLSPLLPCVYQKIYYDYFRLSDREVNNPSFYNLDLFYDESTIEDSEYVADFFVLRYRPAKRDFFTHQFVSPVFSMSSGMSLGIPDSSHLSDLFHNWYATYQNASEGMANGQPDTLHLNDSVQATVHLHSNSAGVGLTPTDIRTSFALQKYLEVTRRAGKHIDAQTLAHFGVKPPKRVAGEVIHLGHHSQNISIGDVISTANTGQPINGSLGAVGGKGYGYGKSKYFDYVNDEACPVVVMAIYSAEVDYDYSVTGLDRLNSYINRSDFYTPEFDNLGMQPIFGYQFRYFGGEDPLATTHNSQRIGWQYRWMESKCKYNRVLGSLSRSLYYWSAQRFNEPYGGKLSYFLVSPFALNAVLVTPYSFDGSVDLVSPFNVEEYRVSGVNPSSLFGNDPLLHELYFDVKKSSTMSNFGLEQL